MSIPQRSLRLERRSAKSLNVLSGASGELFYDVANGTLRLYTNNAGERVIMATRDWVTDQIGITGFDGDYNSLSNIPVFPTQVSSFTNDAGYITVDEVPDVDITTIGNIGDVDTNSPANGQLLQYDGTNWVNSTVDGFADTDTTYVLSADAALIGVDLNLTDVNSNVDSVNVRAGTGVAVSVTSFNEITISSSITIDDLTNTSINTPSDGQTLTYSSGSWLNSDPAASGIALTDFSVASAITPSGDGSLAYDDTTGEFTFTQPDLSSYAELSDFSISTLAALGSGSLQYDNSTGIFTFRPPNLSSYTELSDLSVTQTAPSGTPSLSYSNTTGVFTFNPGTSGGGGDVVNDLTPELGGQLDALTNDIVNVGTISASTYANASAGAPVITSASTITLTAPDGVIVNGDIDVASFALDNVRGISIDTSIGSGKITLKAPALTDTYDLTLPARAQGTTNRIQMVQGINDQLQYFSTVCHYFDVAGASGATAYTFTDDDNYWFPTAADDPVLYLRRGEAYTFDMNASGNPFEIRLSNGGAAYAATNISVTLGNETGQVTFVVPMDAPSTLYYQSTTNSGLGNTINIV